MNPILEELYPDNNVVGRRQTRGFPPLVPTTDQYTTYLHLEMWLCYLNGLDHAAVVTACAVLDFSVKSAIYIREFAEANCIFSPDRWDAIDALEFGRAINMAKSRGVITKDEWGQLESFREAYRNVYMHGATPHWLKDLEVEGVVEGDLKTGAVRERNIKLRDNLTIQRQFRIVADRKACNEVIPAVDQFARELAKRSVALLEAWQAKNPSKTTLAQVQGVLENMRKQGLKADRVLMRDLPTDLREPPTAT